MQFFQLVVRTANYVKERPILIILTMSIWIFGLNYSCIRFANYTVENTCAMDSLKYISKEKKEFALKENALHLTKMEENRMIMFQTAVEKRKYHHYKVMRFFMIDYYADIMVLCLIGPITGILLFFMLQGGFNNSSQGMKTLFVVHAAASIIFSGFPSIFKMEDNIAINKELYTKYTSVENDLFTYLATGKTEFETNYCVSPEILDSLKARKTKTDSLCFNALISVNNPQCIVPFSNYAVKLDVELRQMENISIGFDFSKVPNYKTINKEFNDVTKSSGQ
jgi:hypothetical protein